MARLVQKCWQAAEEGALQLETEALGADTNEEQTLEAIHYTRKLNNIEELIYENAMTCKKIISHALHFYGLERHELVAHSQEMEKRGRSADRISVSQTLKHFVRDWADEGAKERNDAFPCILSTLENIRSEGAFDGLLRVLLPGSGVGRLGHEVAKLGGKYRTTRYTVLN